MAWESKWARRSRNNIRFADRRSSAIASAPQGRAGSRRSVHAVTDPDAMRCSKLQDLRGRAMPCCRDEQAYLRNGCRTTPLRPSPSRQGNDQVALSSRAVKSSTLKGDLELDESAVVRGIVLRGASCSRPWCRYAGRRGRERNRRAGRRHRRMKPCRCSTFAPKQWKRMTNYANRAQAHTEGFLLLRFNGTSAPGGLFRRHEESA